MFLARCRQGVGAEAIRNAGALNLASAVADGRDSDDVGNHPMLPRPHSLRTSLSKALVRRAAVHLTLLVFLV
jgi:hypothetical protein